MAGETHSAHAEAVILSIPSDPKLLRVVRCLVSELATLAGFEEESCDKICLAVDEACSNIIRHSYKGRTDGEIRMRCRCESDKLVISIRDFGEKFDLACVQPRDLEETKPGGLGIHMMRNIMDRLEYDCSHEVGTELHMTKYVPPPGGHNGG